MRGGAKERGILLSVDTWIIEASEDGKFSAGIKGFYYPDESLEDWERQARGEGNIAKGFKPKELSLQFSSEEKFYAGKQKLVSVPGMYDFKIEYRDYKVTNEYNGVKTAKTVQGTIPVDLEFVGDIMLEVVPPGEK